MTCKAAVLFLDMLTVLKMDPWLTCADLNKGLGLGVRTFMSSGRALRQFAKLGKLRTLPASCSRAEQALHVRTAFLGLCSCILSTTTLPTPVEKDGRSLSHECNFVYYMFPKSSTFFGKGDS